MSTPIFWRTNQQRYRLQGAICPTCTTVLFPPRACCPACQQQTAVAKRRVSSPTSNAHLDALLPTPAPSDRARRFWLSL
ncbi:MAG: zinc ribbon domain-containing protein [Chloroflexi bacterium]|nr:zinc ribbon domain-containing protein [Chloroflexota bacterium]